MLERTFRCRCIGGVFFEKNLPDIPDGKKLAYIQFNVSMTAIEDFGKMKEKDSFFKELDACCKNTKASGQKKRKGYCLHILEESRNDLYSYL